MDRSTLYSEGLENTSFTDLKETERPAQMRKLKTNSKKMALPVKEDIKTTPRAGHKHFKSVMATTKLKVMSKWYDDRSMPPELVSEIKN